MVCTSGNGVWAASHLPKTENTENERLSRAGQLGFF